MNKKNIIIGLLIAFVVVYIGGIFVFSQYLYPTTQISDNKVGMITRSSLDKHVKTAYNKQTISIKDEVVTDYSPKLVDLGASIDSENLAKDIAANQNPFYWPVAMFYNQNYDLTKYVEVDEGTLNGKLITDKILENDDRQKSVNAKSAYNEDSKQFEIKDEVYGTVLNDKFSTDLVTAIKSGESEFDATAYYKKPKVVKEDLAADVELLNSQLNREITVTFGKQEKVIPKAEVANFILIDDEGNLGVDNTVLYNYLFELSSSYDSAATTGGTRYVTMYNVDNAYYQIENAIIDGGDSAITAETKVEKYEQDPRQTSIPLSSTYIEVSISNQYMWLYNDGELVLGTNVVTGSVADDWDTPTGTFSVWNKETNKVLNGATVGYDYKVPVNYWMAIDYTGVGIHDIDWLTSSNASSTGDTYLTEGSHGCINVPDDLMATVYNNTPVGTPVYVMP